MLSPHRAFVAPPAKGTLVSQCQRRSIWNHKRALDWHPVRRPSLTSVAFNIISSSLCLLLADNSLAKTFSPSSLATSPALISSITFIRSSPSASPTMQPNQPFPQQAGLRRTRFSFLTLLHVALATSLYVYTFGALCQLAFGPCYVLLCL